MKITYSDLTLERGQKYRLWRFTNSNEEEDEFEIEWVYACPGMSPSGLIIVNPVVFADGSTHWAILDNVSNEGDSVNEHFLGIDVWHHGKIFQLARYHDLDYKRRNPRALAKFVGKKLSDVFLITYDLREVLRSDDPGLCGMIKEKPSKKLTKGELISWVFKGLESEIKDLDYDTD